MEKLQVKKGKVKFSIEGLQDDLISVISRLNVIMDTEAQIISKLENRDFDETRNNMNTKVEQGVINIINAKIDLNEKNSKKTSEPSVKNEDTDYSDSDIETHGVTGADSI